MFRDYKMSMDIKTIKTKRSDGDIWAAKEAALLKKVIAKIKEKAYTADELAEIFHENSTLMWLRLSSESMFRNDKDEIQWKYVKGKRYYWIDS